MTKESTEIIQLRKYLAKQSYKYYIEFSEEVTDFEWDTAAYKLVELQKTHGKEHGWEDSLFSDWDGSTGMHIAMKGKDLC